MKEGGGGGGVSEGGRDIGTYKYDYCSCPAQCRCDRGLH